MAKLQRGTNFEKFFKMRNVVFVIYLFFGGSVLAQNPNATKSEGPKKIKHELLTMQGEVAYYQNKVYTGLSFTFWENKKINEQFTWRNGLLDGEYRQNTPDGKLVTWINYSNGIKNGPYEYYYDNGAMQSQGQFLNGELEGEINGYYSNGVRKYSIVYSNGVRNGRSRSWFKNGAPEQLAYYVNNVPNGEVYEYYQDSMPWSESEYKMGVRHGRYYQFHKKSGCPAIESYYKNGKLDSIRRVWSEVNCGLIEEEHYINGQKDGEFVLYDFTGDTLTVKHFSKGLLNGEYLNYYNKTQPEIDPTTGVVKSYDTKRGIEVRGNYKDDKPDGFWEYGLVSNYQHREGNYEAGVMVGHWIFYDTKGRVLMEQDYDNDGNIVKEKLYKRPKKKKAGK